MAELPKTNFESRRGVYFGRRVYSARYGTDRAKSYVILTHVIFVAVYHGMPDPKFPLLLVMYKNKKKYMIMAPDSSMTSCDILDWILLSLVLVMISYLFG